MTLADTGLLVININLSVFVFLSVAREDFAQHRHERQIVVARRRNDQAQVLRRNGKIGSVTWQQCIIHI